MLPCVWEFRRRAKQSAWQAGQRYWWSSAGAFAAGIGTQRHFKALVGCASGSSACAGMVQFATTLRVARTAPERCEVAFAPDHDRLALRTMVIAGFEEFLKVFLRQLAEGEFGQRRRIHDGDLVLFRKGPCWFCPSFQRVNGAVADAKVGHGAQHLADDALLQRPGSPMFALNQHGRGIPGGDQVHAAVGLCSAASLDLVPIGREEGGGTRRGGNYEGRRKKRGATADNADSADGGSGRVWPRFLSASSALSAVLNCWGMKAP